jgi:hypothetical protein
VEFVNLAFDAEIQLNTPYDEDRKQERK